ncbi:hypothetical protein TNCT_574741 [Trichonephila clavata]|uniref:Uncharacterized protein n=1 Tax=Trichonephila clavata TaxID=2740835 RepID=A0A8X6H373_TRICU|nr:hypothetical protein TNCT_574741 [Trichonephila clavata]
MVNPGEGSSEGHLLLWSEECLTFFTRKERGISSLLCGHSRNNSRYLLSEAQWESLNDPKSQLEKYLQGRKEEGIITDGSKDADFENRGGFDSLWSSLKRI